MLLDCDVLRGKPPKLSDYLGSESYRIFNKSVPFLFSVYLQIDTHTVAVQVSYIVSHSYLDSATTSLGAPLLNALATISSPCSFFMNVLFHSL